MIRFWLGCILAEVAALGLILSFTFALNLWDGVTLYRETFMLRGERDRCEAKLVTHMAEKHGQGTTRRLGDRYKDPRPGKVLSEAEMVKQQQTSKDERGL